MFINKNKKILLTSGCSFTDPAFYSLDTSIPNDRRGGWPMWPKLMADELNLDCVNFAQSGAGNDFILHSLIKGLYKHGDEVDTVAVLWSGADRLFFYNRHTSPKSDIVAATFPEHWSKSLHNITQEKRKKDNNGLYDISEKFWNSGSFNWTVYHTMIDNWLDSMAIILDLCLSKNIKIVMGQGVEHWCFQWLDSAYAAGAIPKSSVIPGNVILRYTLDHPSFAFLEKNQDSIIGWPIFQQLGGYYLEHPTFFEKYVEKEKRKQNTKYHFTQYHISEMDAHPSKLGQERYAKIFLEKYRELYG